MRLTAADIVRAIGRLPRDRAYGYVSGKNAGKIRIETVVEPEGPIFVRRYNPEKNQGLSSAARVAISVPMIWRLANAMRPNLPVNVDRVFGGSYNTRSVLEALLAHTPEFHWCMPGRIQATMGSTEIRKGHKHLMWMPDDPHTAGVIHEAATDIVISEVPAHEAVYGAVDLTAVPPNREIDIDVQRRHAQIQIALVEIGRLLGFRTWVAQNDRGIVYKQTPIGNMKGVVPSLEDEKLLSAHHEAVRAALLIDCIWFKNGRLMPAVMEVEHTTGVTSGLTRMKNFQDRFPPFPTRWVIVAPDEDREHVIRESNKPQFESLDAQFFPYSAVEELYSLGQRRGLGGVTDAFLDNFMERCRPVS
jgi:type II restriction enzyme